MELGKVSVFENSRNWLLQSKQGETMEPRDLRFAVLSKLLSIGISPCLPEGKPTNCGHQCGFPTSHPTPSPLGHRSDGAQSCPCCAAGTGPVKIFHSCRHPPCRKHCANIQRTSFFLSGKCWGGLDRIIFFHCFLLLSAGNFS